MRLIDRDVLKNEMCSIDCFNQCQSCRFLKVFLKQPIINQTINQWIPVSEGLPEKFEVVIVSVKTDDYEAVTTDYINPLGLESYWDKHFDDEVIAWRPLPSPYKESDNND